MLKNVLKLCFLVVFIAGLMLKDTIKMPVEGAGKQDYHKDSFWYYPWGKSITHKGIDIFAKKGTNIHSSSKGFVLYTGQISMGGNIVVILGPKWRLHYYAHLENISTSSFKTVNHNDKIGTVGDSGNAKGKPPHLHYSIVTLIPLPWRIDASHQGWKKMFYLNPSSLIQY